jgi:hypothetical protein
MITKFFARNTALVGLAALALAGSPVLAAPSRPAGICANSTATIRQLATIDNDDAGTGDFQCLGLSLEGDTVKGIRLETHRFASAGAPAYADDVTVAEFSLATLASSHGAVLDGVPGHDAIILRGNFSTPPRSAELVLSYLYNGITSDYRDCPMTLNQAPPAGWRLVNRLDQTVSLIVVRTRKMFLFGTIGIDNLEGACT